MHTSFPVQIFARTTGPDVEQCWLNKSLYSMYVAFETMSGWSIVNAVEFHNKRSWMAKCTLSKNYMEMWTEICWISSYDI